MNLQLSLKTKWFEMTKSGIKTEDYREINEYWLKRLFKDVLKEDINFLIRDLKTGQRIESVSQNYLTFLKPFTQNTMTLGYPKSSDAEKILKLEHKGIEISTGNPDWGAEPGKLYFVIKHGEILK